MDNVLQRSMYNRAVILNCVRRCGDVSRTRIRELTGIRMASITELVKELVDDGLVAEKGTAGNGSDRGRKRTQLKLNEGYGFAVGIEFDADHVAGVVLDVRANVVAEARVNEPCGGDRETGVGQIVDMVCRLVKQADISADKLVGIGVADPGLVDSEKGVSVLCTTVEGWENVPIRQLIGERFGVSIHLEENTRAKLLAEKAYGVGRGVGHLMFIDFGSGVGCSVMSPAGVYRGRTESAGELGHTCVVENGAVCRCGSYGCLETVASLPAIGRRARVAMDEGAQSLISKLAGGNEKVTADHVFEAARQGDKLALSIVDETGRFFGLAVANAVNLFNPEVVIFDQRLAEIGDLLLDPIKRTVARQALQIATRDLRFELSRMGEMAGAMGAATLVLDDLFAIPQLPIPDFMGT